MRLASALLLSVALSACGVFKGAKNDGPSGWSGKSSGKAAVDARAGGANEGATDAPAALGGADGVRMEAAEAAEHKAAAYAALADMLRAEARGDAQAIERALEEAMGHARALMGAEDGSITVSQDPEVRELYRSVVTAYESHYGAVDTTSVEYGDIFRLRDEMFAALNDVDEPLTDDVALPEVERIGGTIPMTTNRLVEQSVQYLQKSPEKHVYPWMRRSGTYFPMIERILREEGVPDELKYLAMIESGLIPKARSRVGAQGMWQFMPATGRAYGLRITEWIDERNDPVKATRAAARHLRDLYEMFGDWHLALAAYNCGPTRVRRAVDRFQANGRRKANFWDIYRELPRETRNYVPMYIAAAMVATDPASFGLSRVEPGPSYEFDVVEVEGPMDLQVAAELAETRLETLRDLNPEIRQHVVPPGAYRLRIPSGMARAFDRSYAALPEEERRRAVEHTVRRGESLSRIAQRYGTSVATLRSYNSIRGSVIHPGQKVIVPVSGRSTASRSSTPVRAAAYTSGPSAETDAGSRNSSARSAKSSARNASANSSGSLRVRHTVRRGENLTRIARQYGVTVSDLRRWNSLSSSRILAGQTLTIYPDGESSSSLPRQRWISYKVKRGDTLTSIAQRYDATPAEVRKWNALRTDVIRVGQRLAIFTR